MNKCRYCNQPTKNDVFCSAVCMGKNNYKEDKAIYNLICERCNRPFTHHLLCDIKLGRMKYCSNECKNRKYDINGYYFNELTPDTLFTLGQIVATGYIKDYRTIKLYSDKATIEDICKKLGSTYPIVKSDRGRWQVTILSDKLVDDLVRLGLGNNMMTQELVPYDILEGLKSTDMYEVYDDGTCVFRSLSSKLILGLQEIFGGKVVTQIFKDVYRGVFGMIYVLMIKDDISRGDRT